jgi:Glycoside hydrolase 123, catalytic domain/Glycoside hydrolase 123, N-terminal domain
MIAPHPIRLLSLAALIFMLHPVFKLSAAGEIPAGANILFLDGIISGKALVPSTYGDTVRFEKPVSFTLEPESFLSFDLHCSGYQRLRIYACEKEDSTKSVLLTRFNTNGPDRFNIALDGNFHNFHWRQGNYSALEAGDSIVQLVFEFTLREDSPGSIQMGEITVYSLTEAVHRKHAEKILAEAKNEVAEIPDHLKSNRNRLNELLDSAESMLDNPSLLSVNIKAIAQEIEVINEKAERINNYYSPAREALGREKIDYCVGWETGLRRVTHANRCLKFEGSVPAEPRISLAQNEYEAFQLVILPFDSFLRDVRVTCSDLEGPAGRIAAENMSVGLPGLVQTQLSPHSNGADLGWVPDPIMPLKPGGTFNVGLEEAPALWIEVYAPSGTSPGTYNGTVTIEPVNSHPTVVPVQLTVWDYEIPLQGVFRTQGHFSIERIERFYHRKADNQWLKEWYDFCLDYRFDPVGQYSDYLTPRAELIPFCLERGLNTIIIGELANPDKVDPGTLDSVYNLVKENGWLEYSYAYIGDETDNFPLMRNRADFIHTRCPGVKVMIGGSIPRPELIGYIDVWDPIMRPHGVYGFDAEACREALTRGEEVLWYVCIAPHPPYPNVQLEDPLVDSRSLFWMTYKYDIMGYEYWAYLFWEKNQKPAGEPRWPQVEWNSYAYDHTNGDGLLCYPGPDGLPVPSVRLAVNRDGIEDWEALWIMEDLARTARELHLDKDKQVAEMVSRAQALAEIPDEVVQDLTHYTKEPLTILRHRGMVSELILGLQEKIGKERAEQYRIQHRNERETEEQEALWRNIERARGELK